MQCSWETKDKAECELYDDEDDDENEVILEFSRKRDQKCQSKKKTIVILWVNRKNNQFTRAVLSIDCEIFFYLVLRKLS